MPRATMSLTSSQDSDCQPAGELTVRQNRGGPAESQHEATIAAGRVRTRRGSLRGARGWGGGFTAPGGCRTSPPCESRGLGGALRPWSGQQAMEHRRMPPTDRSRRDGGDGSAKGEGEKVTTRRLKEMPLKETIVNDIVKLIT